MYISFLFNEYTEEHKIIIIKAYLFTFTLDTYMV